MRIKIAWIGKTKEPAFAALTEEYLKRISRFTQAEGISLRDEADLLAKFGQPKTGQPAVQDLGRVVHFAVAQHMDHCARRAHAVLAFAAATAAWGKADAMISSAASSIAADTNQASNDDGGR